MATGDIILGMKQVTTVAGKLQVPKNISSEIDETLEAFAAACEWISNNTPLDLTNKTKMQKLVYKQVRVQFGLSSNLAIQAVRRVCGNRKTARQKNRNPRKFSPSSANYDARIFSFRDSDWSVSIKLLTNRVRISLQLGNYQKKILKGQNPKSATLVKRRHGDYYIHINLEHDAPEPNDTKEILGIDLGRVDIAHTSQGDKWDGQQLKAKRNHYAWLRLILQKKASLGTRSSRRRCRQLLARLSGKEKRFHKQINHLISRRLVELAATNGQAIALEDLTGIRERTNQLPRTKTERRHSNNWSFYMLRQFLSYKCILKGVPLILVNPAYTSQTCHKCLHLGKRNGKHFQCVNSECNWRGDADRNGAENIAALGRSINTPVGSGLACRLAPGVGEYIQLSLFSYDLGLLKTRSSSVQPKVG